MQSMLNDKEYSATVYGSEGPVGTYCPAADARSMLTTVIADTTKINKTEAAALADAHQFSKAEVDERQTESDQVHNKWLV